MLTGCSEHSEFKQQCFREFMSEHTAICREIGKRWERWEYLYIDLFAGPGYVPIKPAILGSPIIALRAMEGMSFRAMAFEEDEENMRRLADRIWDCAVFGRWQDNLEIALDDLSAIDRRGLIYADPNKLAPNDLSLIDCLAGLANRPRTSYCDILLHVPATTWKRVQGAGNHPRSLTLTGELGRIGKKVIKVSAPDRQWQWVFFLLTNFPSPRFGKAVGWYDIGSPRGKLIVDRITKTREELDREIPQGYLFRPE